MNQKSINKKERFLFICLFFYFFAIIKADDECTSGCKIVDKKCTHINDYLETCEIYCMPDLTNGYCYSCNGILATQFYHFRTNHNGYDKDTSCGSKIVFNTKQCIENCQIGTIKLYEIGGFCYTNDDCQTGNRECTYDGANYKCDCKYLFNITQESGKDLKHCYNYGELCSPEHNIYDMDTRECKIGSCGTKLKKVEHRDGQSDITRCSNSCANGEIISGEYCLDQCSVNQYKYTDADGKDHCTNSCNNIGQPYILDGNKCNSTCNLYKYDNNSCLGSCASIYFITNTNNDGTFCSSSCQQSTTYKYIDGRECKKNCTTLRYKKLVTHNICVPNSGCYLKYNENNEPKECFSSCYASGMPYYIESAPYICYNDCTNTANHKVHNEGEYKCLENCADNYYQIGQICYCYLYAIEKDGDLIKKVCYKDEKECKDKGYNYRKGNECLKTCNPYFEVENEVSVGDNYLKICFNSANECKSNNYYYYNTYKLKCWNICPSNMWSIEINLEGKPQEDLSQSTCVDECGNIFPKHTYGIKI